jgi:hypothetical protein
MNTKSQPNPSKFAIFGMLPKKETSSNMLCRHPSHSAPQWLWKGWDKFLLLYLTLNKKIPHPKPPPNAHNNEEPGPNINSDDVYMC